MPAPDSREVVEARERERFDRAWESPNGPFGERSEQDRSAAEAGWIARAALSRSVEAEAPRDAGDGAFRDVWQHDETGRIVELPIGSPSPGARYALVATTNTPPLAPALDAKRPALPLTEPDDSYPAGEKWADFPERAKEWIRRAQDWLWYLADRNGGGRLEDSLARVTDAKGHGGEAGAVAWAVFDGDGHRFGPCFDTQQEAERAARDYTMDPVSTDKPPFRAGPLYAAPVDGAKGRGGLDALLARVESWLADGDYGEEPQLKEFRADIAQARASLADGGV